MSETEDPVTCPLSESCSGKWEERDPSSRTCDSCITRGVFPMSYCLNSRTGSTGIHHHHGRKGHADDVCIDIWYFVIFLTTIYVLRWNPCLIIF